MTNTNVFVASKAYPPGADFDVLAVFSTLDAGIDFIKKRGENNATVIKTDNGGAYLSQSGDTQLRVECFQLDKS